MATLNDNEVFRQVSKSIETYNAFSGEKDNKGFASYFLLKHNKATKKLIPDAKLFYDFVGISEKQFLKTYKRNFGTQIEIKNDYNHDLLQVSHLHDAKFVTILPGKDRKFETLSGLHQVIRDNKMSQDVARFARASARNNPSDKTVQCSYNESKNKDSNNEENVDEKFNEKPRQNTKQQQTIILRREIKKALKEMGEDQTALLVLELIQENVTLKKGLVKSDKRGVSIRQKIKK